MAAPSPTSSTRTSLGQRLVALFVLFSAGPLFLSNTWGYRATRDSLTEHAFRSVRDVAALEASQVLVYVDAKRDLVPLTIAGNLHLFTLLRSLQAQSDPQVLEALERALRKLLLQEAAEEPDAQELLVLSARGALLASTDDARPFQEDHSADPCFRVGSAGPRVVGFEYPQPQQPTLVVAAPVVDEFGKSWGVFCARFAFDLHQQLAAARALRTPLGALYLVDAGGRVVDAAVGEGASVALGAPLTRPRPLVGGTSAWDERYLLPGGEDTIGAWAPVAHLGWGVLVEVPVSRALADLTRLRWQAAGAGALLAALLVVMVMLAARGVTRPLRRLSTAARSVAEGRLGELVPAGGPVEVAELADSFNQMSLSLRLSHQLLEQRVTVATRELSQSQAFTELLLNSMDQRLVVVDASLRVIKANRVALRACGEDLVGRAVDEPGEDGPLVCAAGPVRRTFDTGEPTTTERSERRGDRLEVVRLDTLRVGTGEGPVQAVMVVGRVVTAEKRLQGELEKMATFGRLAAGVAHEVGNPLASVAAQLRMNRDAPDPERTRQTFAVVEREVDRVTRLLRELMTFGRRRPDGVTLVQLNDVVADVSRLVAFDERTRQVRIEARPAPGLPGVRGKEDHVTQVLLNLALNAIDAMGGRGTLTLETSADERSVTCRVKDTGSGIPPEVLAHVFEPFFTTKEPGRGTGLGLFVSRNLVDTLGGTLTIERTSSEGTVFAVRLPRA